MANGVMCSVTTARQIAKVFMFFNVAKKSSCFLCGEYNMAAEIRLVHFRNVFGVGVTTFLTPDKGILNEKYFT